MPDNELEAETLALQVVQEDPGRELGARLSGTVAARFRKYHEALQSSEDLDHLKLGQLSQSDLLSYALCEWLKFSEEQFGKGQA